MNDEKKLKSKKYEKIIPNIDNIVLYLYRDNGVISIYNTVIKRLKKLKLLSFNSSIVFLLHKST